MEKMKEEGKERGTCEWEGGGEDGREGDDI